MANSAAFFTRVLADLFMGKPPAAGTTVTEPTPATTPAPMQSGVPQSAPAASAAAHVIGRGAANETVITIADEPNLFVEEAQCVVQFKPAFDEQAGETPFGLKILPELAPHWSQIHIHHCSLREAIASAIRSGGKPVAIAPAAAPPRAEAASSRHVAPGASPESAPAHPAPRREHSHDTGAVTGRVISWGEERFPDRKKPGRLYDSFAMHIDAATGERTLQGEGLKEAIAEARCQIGDRVSVRRLRKIQVPAIRKDGSPKLVDGKQVMWDKWLWSITK